MSHSPDVFTEFRHEELRQYARRWAEGPLDPGTEKSVWKVPIDRIILYGRTHHHGPGLYVVVFELTDNEHSSTYKDAKMGLEEFVSPVPIPQGGINSLSEEDKNKVRKYINEVGFTRTGKTLSPEHEEIDKLVCASGQYSTTIDEGRNSLPRLLLDDGFEKKVYAKLPRNQEGVYEKGFFRKQWKFHVLFPGDQLPKVIDERGASLVLYDEAEEKRKGFEFDLESGLKDIDREIEDWKSGKPETVKEMHEKSNRVAELQTKRERHLAYLRSGNDIDEKDSLQTLRDPVGAPSVTEPGEQKELNAKTKYAFLKTGPTWKIVFMGREISGLEGIGFLYLHYLMKNPTERLTAVELEDKLLPKSEMQIEAEGKREKAGKHPGDISRTINRQKILDKKGTMNLIAHIKVLKVDLAKAERQGDEPVMKEIHDEIVKCEEQVLNSRRVFKDETSKAKNRVGQVMKRAIETLQAEDSDLGRHISSAFRKPFAGVLKYEPTEKIFWNFG
jgi:hypothetical protein